MEDLKLLFKLLTSSVDNVKKVIRGALKKHPTDCITDGDNYFYYPSKSPIVLVSHIDTVNRYGRVLLRYNPNSGILRNQMGILGGDDRAGVYALLMIASKIASDKDNKIPMPGLLFTNYEESGGVGVSTFLSHKILNNQNHIKFFVEADRLGKDQYVVYNTLPEELHKFMKKHGFIESYGSYSDVHDITHETNIPSVNVSIGYYNQHTSREYINTNHLRACVNRLFSLIKNTESLPKYNEKGDYRGYGYGCGSYYGYSDFYEDYCKEEGKKALKHKDYVEKMCLDEEFAAAICLSYKKPTQVQQFLTNLINSKRHGSFANKLLKKWEK